MIWRPLHPPHLRRISALCAARSLAYLSDMSALSALLRLELHPHLGGQRSHMAKTLFSDGLISRISLTFATAFIHSRNCAPVNYPARMGEAPDAGETSKRVLWGRRKKPLL